MTHLRYVSHDVVLDPGRWLLSVGGENLTPEPKVFELLSYLMRHQGRVVSKAELLDSLWSGDVVGESVLTRCVSVARKLLADDAKTPKFIRTAHGRGYEFIAPVIELSHAAPGLSSVPAPAAPEPGAMDGEGTAVERPFIGRKRELTCLSQALRQLESRKGDWILVSGDPGIGKTRLLEEARRGAPPGIEVHAARCATVEGAPPFLVWQQLFRSIVRARSIRAVRRAFDGAPSGARRLLLDTHRPQDEDQPGWDSPSERFRTFDALARGLSDLARQRPFALLLDDLHAADLVSLLLFEFLTQALVAPVLLIGAMRDGEAPGDRSREEALARIRGACRSEILLSGLNPGEVEEFVQQRFVEQHEQLAASLFSRTGGNPFFLSVLTPSGDLPRVSQTALPVAVHQAVSYRLATLDAECLKLLRTAAVCGQTFDALVLARAADLPVEHCVQQLASGCVARLIVNSGLTEYRFVHDLIREVLVAELDTSERPFLHLAVGRALQTLPTYRDARHAAMLAHHFVEAVHCGGASSAVDLSIRAGAYCLRNFGYEEAIAHFSRASRLLPLSSEADAITECAVLLDLGLAQVSAGNVKRGKPPCELRRSERVS